MYAAAEVVAGGLRQFLDGFGEERWPDLCEEIWDRSEAAIRKEIEAFKDGTYAYQIDLDGRETPLKIIATVTVEGDTIFVDYEGTSPQVAYGINSPFCYSFSYTCYSLKCLCNPDIPNNDGTFRAFQMKAPEGSILNPRYPAPTAALSCGRSGSSSICSGGETPPDDVARASCFTSVVAARRPS